MRRVLSISLISIATLITIYFVVALTLIFRPEPTFAQGPFPAAQPAAAEFEPRSFIMRDGQTLFARHFPADSDLTILLVHGVTSGSAALNDSAEMLREVSGAEILTLDLRGHGQSGGTAGDVDYIGQYEDDLADVVKAIRESRPNGRLILSGHSMGGGIALRYAMLSNRPAVDGYLLFAPHLGSQSPTTPPPDPAEADLVAAYTQLHVPRFFGLLMLNWVGITRFNHLETLYFNLTDDITHTYSFRAMVNTSPVEHGPALSAVDAPMLVVVGRNDEAFAADQYPATVTRYSEGEVHLIDGGTHNTILVSSAAMMVIERWLTQAQFADQETFNAQNVVETD